MSAPRETYHRIAASLASVTHGQELVIRRLLAAFARSGHVLLEDYPGTGKTTLAKALPRTIGAAFKRVQFTPFAQGPGEPLAHWLDAVAATSSAIGTAPLRAPLALHYRLRFDPAGLAASEHRRLRAEVEAWLGDHPPGPASARAAAP